MKTAISCLDITIQNTFRHLAHSKMQQPLQCNSSHYILYKRQVYVLKQFRNKLQKHYLIIIYADKGKTVAIIHSDKYHQTIDTLLIQNQL